MVKRMILTSVYHISLSLSRIIIYLIQYSSIFIIFIRPLNPEGWHTTLMTLYIFTPLKKSSTSLISSCFEIDTCKIKKSTECQGISIPLLFFYVKDISFGISHVIIPFSEGTLLVKPQNGHFHPYTICSSTPISPISLSSHPIPHLASSHESNRFDSKFIDH